MLKHHNNLLISLFKHSTISGNKEVSDCECQIRSVMLRGNSCVTIGVQFPLSLIWNTLSRIFFYSQKVRWSL